MWAFLLLLVLGYLFIWPLVKVGIAVRNTRNSVRDAFRQAADQAAAREQRRQPQKPRRRKVISRDVGEYIDFEEITVQQTQGGSTTYTETRYTEESQIEDAEWEDIR